MSDDRPCASSPSSPAPAAGQGVLFDSQTSILDQNHYLGSAGARARFVYQDDVGVIVFSSPTSRRLPADWLELSRWCLIQRGGAGSGQWKRAAEWIKSRSPATTVVSYSDPSVGHTGALYRACNWIWAPTWHVLREPPTGAGIRAGRVHRAKHRWVYLLRPDPERAAVLALRDESLERAMPWVGYREPKWKRGHPILSGQDRFRRWWSAHGMSSPPESSGAEP